MSPSSMFSRGSRSPFVFWPSKISRSLQNQVTVLSCRTKYFVFQYHKLYLWFGLIATILLTKITVIVTWFLGFLWETSMNMELIIEWPNLDFSKVISTIIVPITWRPRKRSCWWSQVELLLCIRLPLLPGARTSKTMNNTESMTQEMGQVEGKEPTSNGN